MFISCNMIDKIVHKNRWASDNHIELIEMWKYLQLNVQLGVRIPKRITERTYIDFDNTLLLLIWYNRSTYTFQKSPLVIRRKNGVTYCSH